MGGDHMTQAFYKLHEGLLLQAPNAVLAPDYELRKELKDTYTYPVDGWTWFNSEAEAYWAFELTQPEPEPVVGATGPAV